MTVKMSQKIWETIRILKTKEKETAETNSKYSCVESKPVEVKVIDIAWLLFSDCVSAGARNLASTWAEFQIHIHRRLGVVRLQSRNF